MEYLVAAGAGLDAAGIDGASYGIGALMGVVYTCRLGNMRTWTILE